MLKRYVVIAALAAWGWAPAAAEADWLFTPSIGTTFGADTHGKGHPILGASIGWVDEEAFAWELDVSFAPDFFEGEHDTFTFTGDSHVATGMVNALIGVFNTDQGARAFYPYVAGGVGIMEMRAVTSTVPEEGLFESMVHEFGWNAGAGAMVFPAEAIGIRGDVRYLRSFQNQDPSWTRGIDVDVAPGNFDFWRASVGVTFRFGE
jgi:opacity protein-like surface antigen